MLWFYESFFPVVWIVFVLYWQIKAALKPPGDRCNVCEPGKGVSEAFHGVALLAAVRAAFDKFRSDDRFRDLTRRIGPTAAQ